MQNVVWQNAIETAADPLRARNFADQLRNSSARHQLRGLSAAQARCLTALFSGSQALSETLLSNPDWLSICLDTDRLQRPRRKQGLQREVDQLIGNFDPAQSPAPLLGPLRKFKQREMLRIAVRDLAHLTSTSEIISEISNVADVCLDAVYRVFHRHLTFKFGLPYHQDPEGRWIETGFCIFGMGKLGGQELNYSSDVDLLFAYSEEGHVFKQPPRKSQQTGKGLTNHQFFLRLAEACVTEITRLAEEGMLYRVDMRLRPEGNSGPLVRSLPSYENYYAQWGQTWERMMLIKTRPVAGDLSLGSEFLEMIQPFRYPRSLSNRILQEIASMKDRIEVEVVKAGEIERNVKLGRGGIREIEFIVQTLQLLHGGRLPFLQDHQTLPALEKMVRYKLMASSDAKILSEAYCFFRDVEHRLQMDNNLQTHTIPTERKTRERLAALMKFDFLAAFETAKQDHARNVRQIYDSLLRPEESARRPPLPPIDRKVDWEKLLQEHSFREPERGYQMLQEFVNGPGYVHVSPRTSELALELVPRFLALCPKAPAAAPPPLPPNTPNGLEVAAPQVLSDPDRVLARLDRFVGVYGSRVMLYELWSSNPSLFQLLLFLFDRSEFLAELSIRTPDLVDELELSGRLRRSKNAAEILEDLRHGIADEDQHLWLRRYYLAELMRIGLRDILGLADFEQNVVELTALAEACLQYAIEVVMRKNKLKRPPFAIIGLGKLGGSELNYGSDLDIMFVTHSGQKDLSNLQRLANSILDLLSTPTDAGSTFVTDARLRPDGEKGLLVNTIDAHEEYYRNRAQLWEIQAISRARPIAGDQKVGRDFLARVAALTDFRNPAAAATQPDWMNQIHKMRMRIEKERTPPGKDHLAIKTGQGGLMDAEFIAQALCLACGWQEPNTLRSLQRAPESGLLAPDDSAQLITHYRHLRRIEAILRRWSIAGETLLPDDPAPLQRVSVRCGFANSTTFMEAVTQHRLAIRQIYLKVFAPLPAP